MDCDHSTDQSDQNEVKFSAHVIAVPLRHKEDTVAYSFLCDCADMRDGLDILRGTDSRNSTKQNGTAQPDHVCTAGQCVQCIQSLLCVQLTCLSGSVTASRVLLHEVQLHRVGLWPLAIIVLPTAPSVLIASRQPVEIAQSVSTLGQLRIPWRWAG
ncbi:hypothetical protein WJX75_004397 [Coccomyxa subellipsoidea]|uniref:Uncharacterized protein n=1 Tax=Coccomyxa subellipsoidea TaxID=248742 RepID=A0ABR2YAK1_9CHLO